MSQALRQILAEYGFSLDTSQLQAADSVVESMGDKLAGFGKWVAAAFAVDKVVTFGKQLIDTADGINDTAARLGVSTDELQAWQYAAKLSGIEADELAASLQRLGAGIADAAAGKGGADTFKKLGVSLRGADGQLKTVTQVFEEAGLAIGALTNPTEQAGLAADLFGKSYARLLPLFKEGPEGIAQLRKEFAELGGGLDAGFIESAAAFNDQIDKLSLAGSALASETLAPLVTGLVDLTTAALDFVKGFKVTGDAASPLKLLFSASSGIGRAIVALSAGSKNATLFGLGLKTAGKMARWLIEPLLWLEDFIVFLAGGDSVLGDWIEEAFGAGMSEKVRDAINGALESVNALALALLEPGKLGEDMAKKLEGAIHSIRDEFLALGPAVTHSFDEIWNDLLEGAADAVTRLGKLIAKLPGSDKLGLEFQGAADEILKGRRLPEPGDKSARDDALTGLFSTGEAVVGAARSVPDSLPSAAQIAKSFGGLLSAASSALGASSASAPGQQLLATASAPPAAQWLVDVQAPTRIDVHVPPSTDADLARRVGEGAAKGQAKANADLTAALAATTPG